MGAEAYRFKSPCMCARAGTKAGHMCHLQRGHKGTCLFQRYPVGVGPYWERWLKTVWGAAPTATPEEAALHDRLLALDWSWSDAEADGEAEEEEF